MLARVSSRIRGFTLIEAMVVLVILGVLAAAGMPSFLAMLQNAQIRTAAENIRSGLQAARSEAIRRNALVQFTLDNPTDTGGTGWTISAPNALAAEQTIQVMPSNEGTRNVVLTRMPADAVGTTFDGFGRLASTAANPLLCVKLTNATVAASDMHAFTVAIVSGSEVKLCDPTITDLKDPRTCPLVCQY